jgi:hypothetical protein
MDDIGVVITLEGTLQRATRLVDFGLSQIQILVGNAYGQILVSVILYSCTDTDLLVQGQIAGTGVVIGGRCVISSAHRPQPSLGNAVLVTQAEVPRVVASKILGECGRCR